MSRLFHFLIICFCMYSLTGCAVYSAAVDERNVKTIAKDTTLKTKIVSRFVEDNQVKSLDISAYVYNRKAYLTGQYDTEAQKDRAIALAQGVEGIRQVTAYLRAKRPGDHCGLSDNISLSTKVKNRLIQDGEIRAPNINVESVQCNIVLLGVVPTSRQAAKAVDHAESVAGVRSVTSYLQVSR